MRDNVIYFPYIKVPKSPWFNQILLYWNNVYSIIPDSTKKYYNDPYREKLVENDLIKAAKPEFYLNNISYDNFKPFIDYIKNPNYPVYGFRDDKKMRFNDTIPIRKLKFHHQVLPELLDTGLFKNKNNGWIEVEKYTFKQYMLFLAGLFSELPKYNATPITDTNLELEYFKSPKYQNNGFKSPIDANTTLKNETRDILLREILPAPSKNVSPSEIAEFKRKNSEQLIMFRRDIEKEIIDISNISDSRSREEKRDMVEEDYKSQIKELSEKMKSNGWGNAIKNNWYIFASPTIFIGGYLLHGEVVPESLISAIVAAVYGSHKIYSDKKKIDKYIRNGNFLAYAVLANKNF